MSDLNLFSKVLLMFFLGWIISFSRGVFNIFDNIEEEDQAKVDQITRIIQYLKTLPVKTISIDKVEADDIIAYLAQTLPTKPEDRSFIVSSDKDYLQLVDNNTVVYRPIEKEFYVEQTVKDKFKVTPHNFLLYKLLMADKSDGIPGIRGAGQKTLLKIFPWLGSPHKHTIDDLLKSAEPKKKQFKLCEQIVNSEDQLLLNKKLMDLDDLNISGHSKRTIQDIVENPIQRMVKHKFQKMFLEDKMYTALPNLDSWLHSTFNRLNHMAEKTHG